MDFSSKEFSNVKNPRFKCPTPRDESVPPPQTCPRRMARSARKRNVQVRPEIKDGVLKIAPREPSKDMFFRDNGIHSRFLADNPSLQPGTYRSADITINQKGLIVDINEGTAIRRIEAGPGIEVTFPEPGVAVLNIKPSLELTGTPTAYTPQQGSNNTQVATTAYVDTAVSTAIQAIIAAMTNSR